MYNYAHYQMYVNTDLNPISDEVYMSTVNPPTTSWQNASGNFLMELNCITLATSGNDMKFTGHPKYMPIVPRGALGTCT